MSVFISWSGPRSRAVARALRKYLRLIVPGCQPWMSEADIDAGKVWFEEIIDSLTLSVGVLCVTPENLTKPWLNFEAGALSRKVDKAERNRRVIPYLLDLKPTDVPPPLGMFMAKEVTEEGTRDLARSIGRAIGLPDEDVLDQFRAHYPDLKMELERIPSDASIAKVERTESDKIDELLGLVRQLRPSLGTRPPKTQRARPQRYSITSLDAVPVSREDQVHIEEAVMRGPPAEDVRDFFVRLPSSRVAQVIWEDEGRRAVVQVGKATKAGHRDAPPED